MKKIKLVNIWLLLAILPIFQPKIFTQFKITTFIYIVLNVFELCILLLKTLKCKKSVSKLFSYWIVFRIYLLMVMLLNDRLGGILQWGYLTIMVSNLVLLFDYVKFKNVEMRLIKVMYYLGIFFLLINICTLLIYDRGIITSTYYNSRDNDIYFLGIKTQFTTFMFPTIAAAFMIYEKEKKKKNIYMAFFVFLITLFLKNISTAIVGIILYFIFKIISRYFKINYNLVFKLIIVFQTLFIFLNLSHYFSWFFINVLGKDATLTARVYIWNNAINVLKNGSILTILFGFGSVNGNAFVPYDHSYWQPHSQLLIWLYNGGLVGATFIIGILYYLIKDKFNSKYENNIIISIIILFLTITEGYFDIAVCYVPFLIVYYFSRIKDGELNE